MNTLYGNPHDMDVAEFEGDVYRIIDMYYDDLGIEIQVETGDQGGLFVRVTAVRDRVGVALFPPIATPQVFYSVDGFRKFVNSFAPEDY